MTNVRRPMRYGREPVAFVLSSGAAMGGVQVGMLRALVEHDIHPDLVVGCSVGALNGAGFAQDPTLKRIEHIEEMWRTAGTNGLMPRSWLFPAQAALRRGEAVCSLDELRRAVGGAVTASTFDALAIPFQCVATDVVNASERWFDRGPLLQAIIASAAMPATFPSVEIDGRRYIDGAAVVDVPVRRAVELGARTLYVMETGLLARRWVEPKRPVDMARHAYWIARRNRFQRDLQALPVDVAVHLLPHGDPPAVKFRDFSHSEGIMHNAYVASTVYLNDLTTSGSRPERTGTPTGCGT